MSKIVWDATGNHYYESGVDHGVLYTMTGNTYNKGVAWDGLTAVNEAPEGGDVTDFWADNIKYASLRSAEKYKATIEAYQSPVEFDECDGCAEIADGIKIRQQTRKRFGFCYRTNIGNDTGSEDYILHIVYNASASPSSRDHATINDSPDAATLSWELEATAINVTGHKPTAVLEIDSRTVSAENMAKIEAKLYGDTSNEPTLLTPDEIVALVG